MRVHIAAFVMVLIALSARSTSGVVGRPGITPVACPVQKWELADARFDALPGASAFFGAYDGGIYRIEIPAKWNGELMLSAHGFVSNAGPDGSRLRVGTPAIRQHLIEQGFAWAASSYRCNGYVPGIGLQDTMALVELFTKFNNGSAPRRTYLTGTSLDRNCSTTSRRWGLPPKRSPVCSSSPPKRCNRTFSASPPSSASLPT